MRQELEKHFIEYVLLFSFTLISLGLLMWQQNDGGRFIVLALYVLFYLVWSLVHHVRIKKLTIAVVLEYILLGLMAIVALKIFFFPLL